MVDELLVGAILGANAGGRRRTCMVAVEKITQVSGALRTPADGLRRADKGAVLGVGPAVAFGPLLLLIWSRCSCRCLPYC